MIVLAIFLSTLISSIVAVLLAYTLQKRQGEERKVDMRRQDQVASRVLDASELTND
jgi:Na+-transporting NADH:ubiquinone oxidoreductase subunit NqrC